MDKKYGILIICAVILFLCFVGTASAKTWYVDDDLQDFSYADFTKIQNAVNIASPGDIIIVYNGTYPENIEVDKQLNLWGAPHYLDNQDEVIAYTKVLRRFPIRILYYDKEGYPHYYRPDFIVKTKDQFYMIETKGIGFDDMTTVQLKDESAEKWCESISQLMGIKWQYVKIREDMFEQFKLLKFSEMVDNLS